MDLYLLICRSPVIFDTGKKAIVDFIFLTQLDWCYKLFYSPHL